VYFIERTKKEEKEEEEEDFHEIEVHENQSTMASEISNSQVMVYLELIVGQVFVFRKNSNFWNIVLIVCICTNSHTLNFVGCWTPR